MHDELACITHAMGMYERILDEADQRAWATTCSDDPETELRERLPWMFGRLSPGARTLLRDHLAHLIVLVAGVHQCASIIQHAEIVDRLPPL